jgi:K+/H+ antiporter YhaU regulatory subunit KhtT
VANVIEMTQCRKKVIKKAKTRRKAFFYQQPEPDQNCSDCTSDEDEAAQELPLAQKTKHREIATINTRNGWF